MYLCSLLYYSIIFNPRNLARKNIVPQLPRDFSRKLRLYFCLLIFWNRAFSGFFRWLWLTLSLIFSNIFLLEWRQRHKRLLWFQLFAMCNLKIHHVVTLRNYYEAYPHLSLWVTVSYRSLVVWQVFTGILWVDSQIMWPLNSSNSNRCWKVYQLMGVAVQNQLGKVFM